MGTHHCTPPAPGSVPPGMTPCTHHLGGLLHTFSLELHLITSRHLHTWNMFTVGSGGILHCVLAHCPPHGRTLVPHVFTLVPAYSGFSVVSQFTILPLQIFCTPHTAPPQLMDIEDGATCERACHTCGAGIPVTVPRLRPLFTVGYPGLVPTSSVFTFATGYCTHVSGCRLHLIGILTGMLFCRRIHFSLEFLHVL